MKASRYRTVTLPQQPLAAVGASSGPTLLAAAADTGPERGPLRVLVRNNSVGQYIVLADSANALQNMPAAPEAYKLPAGASDEFILAPGSKLFAASPGVGAEVSVAINDYVIPTVDERDRRDA